MPSDLYSYLYSAEEKILPAEQAWPTPHRQCTIYHATDLCVCHTRGAGPDPPKWLLQDPTLTRELPAKLEEFLWCKGCSWELLIIKTWLGQSLLHRSRWAQQEPWCSPAPGAVRLLAVPGCTPPAAPSIHCLLPPFSLGTAGIPLHYQTETNPATRVRMAWFLSQLWSRTVSSSQEPAPVGKQDPTETWNKHITSVAAFDSGDTAV